MADIDAVFPPVSSATVNLTDQQCSTIDYLRREIRCLCEEGKDKEAQQAADRGFAIISQGPPSSD